MKTTFLFISFFFSLFLYGQKTILWKISSNKGNTVSYLLGTNHLFGDSFVDSFPVIKQKLLASGVVITETKMDRSIITASYKDRPESDSINLVLSKEDVAYIAELFSKRNGIPISNLLPGELIAKLQAYYPKFRCPVLNNNDKLSMDEYIQYLGKNNNKRSYYFETDSFQLDILTSSLNNYNWDFVKRNVPFILKQYRAPKPNPLSCFLIDQYASFDLNYKLNDSCNLSYKISGVDNNIIVKKRNAAWMLQLPKLLEENNCFIAVGLQHLFNQCGLIKQIEALGYIVEPVAMK